ncbi:MAG: helix-turn-helix transcriptional regulator [Clostridiales bacterium]|nr:helix-turn-helix transcriptional regulator [Clostridiales bacterium]
MLKNKLKQLREEHGLSQVELAEKLGKSQNTISSWETGRTMPRMKDMNVLCSLYDCTLESLTGIKQFDANDITVEDILFRLSSLQTDDLERLDAQIKYIIDTRVEMQKVENEKQQLLEKLRSLEAYQKLIESAQ